MPTSWLKVTLRVNFPTRNHRGEIVRTKMEAKLFAETKETTREEQPGVESQIVESEAEQKSQCGEKKCPLCDATFRVNNIAQLKQHLARKHFKTDLLIWCYFPCPN